MRHCMSVTSARSGLCVLVAAVLCLDGVLAAASAQVRRVRSDQEIIEELERDWDAAFQRKDIDFIDSILADDFVATYTDGHRGDKAIEKHNTSAFNQRIDESALSDFEIRIYGDTAIAWFNKTVVGPVKGVRTEIVYRFMDVWVQRDGNWLCVASQSHKFVP